MQPVEIDNCRLILVHGSVAEQDVDAIVNAANTGMRGGGGIDGVIHRKAGKGLLRELEEVAPHGAKTSSVVVTHGHDLPQPFVFHVAGPYWSDGRKQEPDRRELKSIGVCSIFTGVYRFPIELAAPIAVNTVAEYLSDNKQTKIERIVFAMFGSAEYDRFDKALQDLAKGRVKDNSKV
jgi:O-acetyl-ADP-ribose deacetylase (regulator of RNase III)